MNIILAKKLGDTFSLGAFRRFLSFFQCGLQLLAQICELRGSREQAVGERAELVKLLETCTAVYEVFRGADYITEVATGLNLILYFR